MRIVALSGCVSHLHVASGCGFSLVALVDVLGGSGGGSGCCGAVRCC